MRRSEREVMDTEEIRKILGDCKTCHVAMWDGDEEYIVPLNYGYTLENGVLTLYFHSAKEGRKIDIWKRRREVCFAISWEGALCTAPSPCGYGYCYSSVIGWGAVEFIEDAADKCSALSLLFRHQTGEQVDFTSKQAESVCVYKIICTRFTAKRRTI